MFKRLLPVLFLTSPLWAPGPYQADRSFKNTGGLIDHISPLLVPPEKASSVVNYMMDDRGELTARSGWQILNTTNTFTAVINGIGYHNTATAGGTDFFAVISGSNVFRASTNITAPPITFTNVTNSVIITAGAANVAQHTGLNDKEIFCNQVDQPFEVPYVGSATALSGSPQGMVTCTTYISYLIGANTTESSVNYPSRVRWSDINTADSWPANNYIDVEPNDGDKIVSLIQFKDSVYIFKRRSIYRLLSTGLQGADAFIVRPFSRNIGCYAKNSVRVIPNVGIAFASDHTIYILGDNELSSFNYSQLEAIGDPIQRTLDSIQHSMWANMSAAVYPQRYQYVLNVSTAGVSNTETLVYDWIQKSWTTYTGIQFNATDNIVDSNGRNVLLAADYGVGVYLLNENQTYDQPGNVQTPISTSYTTGWLTQDAPDFTKGYKYLYVFTVQNSTAALTVSAGYDYANNFESTYQIGLGNGIAVYDTAKYDVDTYAQSGLVEGRIELNREAKAIKLQFMGSATAQNVQIAGWSIVYQPEDFKQ